MQVGFLALWSACLKKKPEVDDASFSIYARTVVVGRMIDHIRQDGFIPRRAYKELMTGAIAFGVVDDSVLSYMADQTAVDPTEEIFKAQLAEIVNNGVLPFREKVVVRLYYYHDMTMQEIGNLFGYSEAYISLVHATAIDRLRVRLLKIGALPDCNRQKAGKGRAKRS
jgi:RNA polymerase sigma factor (sigma-70 family)